MKIILVTTLLALSTADVSHLQNVNQSHHNNQNIRVSSYTASQPSILSRAGLQEPSVDFNGEEPVPFTSAPSMVVPGFQHSTQVKTNDQPNPGSFGILSEGSKLTLPNPQKLSFGFDSEKPVSFSSAPNMDVLGFQHSTQVKSNERPSQGSSERLTLSSLQKPLFGFDSGKTVSFSSPGPQHSLTQVQPNKQPNQYSSGGSRLTSTGPQKLAFGLNPKNPVPLISTSSIDLSGFQHSTYQTFGSVKSAPSVNLVQHPQTANSFAFINKYNQPSVSSIQVRPFNSVQVLSDAALNSGLSDEHSFKNSFSNSPAYGVVEASKQDPRPEISKNFYFYAAPEEEEEISPPEIYIPQEPPKISYNLVVIKAPTYKTKGAITLPTPPQHQEKTVVYVLVEEPKKHIQAHYPKTQPPQPIKPEVFFIKYDNKKKSEISYTDSQRKYAKDKVSTVDTPTIINEPETITVPKTPDINEARTVSKGPILNKPEVSTVFPHDIINPEVSTVSKTPDIGEPISTVSTPPDIIQSDGGIVSEPPVISEPIGTVSAPPDIIEPELSTVSQTPIINEPISTVSPPAVINEPELTTVSEIPDIIEPELSTTSASSNDNEPEISTKSTAPVTNKPSSFFPMFGIPDEISGAGKIDPR